MHAASRRAIANPRRRFMRSAPCVHVVMRSIVAERTAKGRKAPAGVVREGHATGAPPGKAAMGREGSPGLSSPSHPDPDMCRGILPARKIGVKRQFELDPKRFWVCVPDRIEGGTSRARHTPSSAEGLETRSCFALLYISATRSRSRRTLPRAGGCPLAIIA